MMDQERSFVVTRIDSGEFCVALGMSGGTYSGPCSWGAIGDAIRFSWGDACWACEQITVKDGVEASVDSVMVEDQ